MRGKLLSLALVAAIFGSFFVGLSHGQTPFTIYVDPLNVTGLYPGDSFDLNVYITGGEAIYAWEFGFTYPPYVQQIAVVDVFEGPYLEAAETMPSGTYLTRYVDGFHGKVSATCTLLGQETYGAYGDGLLATVRFAVIEPAGEFQITMDYARLWMTLADPETEPIEIGPEDITVIGDVTFFGGIADIYSNPGETRMDNVWKVGKPRRFKTVVQTTGYEYLWCRAKYTSTSTMGKVVTLYNGQHLYTDTPRATEYYYVNEFTEYRLNWLRTGTSPYLDKADGTSYITGQTYCNTIRYFGFQDITLNPGDIIYRVTLEGRTRAAHADIDYDVYDAAGNWYGSLWGSGAWTWRGVRWTTDTVEMINPAVKTQAGFNSFQVFFHYYTPDGSPLGDADLDAVRLKVEYIGIDPINVMGDHIQPNNIRTLDWAIWDLWAFDVDTWTTIVTLEYRLGTPDPRFPQYWATGATVATFTWTCHP